MHLPPLGVTGGALGTPEEIVVSRECASDLTLCLLASSGASTFLKRHDSVVFDCSALEFSVKM